MGGEQEEGHPGARLQRDNMAEDLRSWFCQLSTQERLQVNGFVSFWAASKDSDVRSTQVNKDATFVSLLV